MTEPSDAELTAVFGRRADYYLAQWHGTAKRRFNWSAAIFMGFWLAYRRMTVPALVLFAVLIGEVILEALFFAVVSLPTVEVWLSRVIAFLLVGVFGVFGNEFYIAQVRRRITKVQAMQLPQEAHLQALQKSGGTSIIQVVATLFFLAVLVIVGGILLVLLGVE